MDNNNTAEEVTEEDNTIPWLLVIASIGIPTAFAGFVAFVVFAVSCAWHAGG